MGVVILLAALGVTHTALAHPGGHGPGAGGRTVGPNHEPAVAIPKDLAGVVRELDRHLDAAQVAIDDARIVDLYRACDALEVLSNAVPAKALELSPEQQTAAHDAADALTLASKQVLAQARAGDAAAATVALTAARAEHAKLVELVPAQDP